MVAAGPEMTVGSVLARTFGMIGAAPVRFFGISFLFSALPYMLLEIAGAVNFSGMAVAPNLAPVLIAGAAIVILWLLLYATAETVLIQLGIALTEGRSVSRAESVTAGLRLFLPVAGISILFWLGVWAGSLLLVVPGLMLATAWSVAAPALIDERIGIVSAFGRSAALTKGARWRIFGLAALVLVIYLVAAAALGIADVAVNGVAAVSTREDASLLSTILSGILQTVFVAVWTALQAALYVELRDWKDGPTGGRLAEIFA